MDEDAVIVGRATAKEIVGGYSLVLTEHAVKACVRHGVGLICGIDVPFEARLLVGVDATADDCIRLVAIIVVGSGGSNSYTTCSY